MESLTDEPVANSESKVKVLLVDDDDFIHAIIRLALRRTRYAVSFASNVDQAMRLMQSEAPDVVITDAMMPGVSGFDLIRTLKSHPESATIPVMLLTSLESECGGVMDATGKADVTLAKPFKVSELLSSLNRAESLIEHSEVFTAATAGSGGLGKESLSW